VKACIYRQNDEWSNSDSQSNIKNGEKRQIVTKINIQNNNMKQETKINPTIEIITPVETKNIMRNTNHNLIAPLAHSTTST